MLKREVKDKIIKDYAIKKGDTGSVEVQVALLTEEINILTDHLKDNIHDYHSKRGLLIKVGKRKSLLDYLSRGSNRSSSRSLIALVEISVQSGRYFFVASLILTKIDICDTIYTC